MDVPADISNCLRRNPQSSQRNTMPAVTDTPPASGMPAMRSTILTGRRLVLVRAAWLFLFALFVGIFLLGAPAAYRLALQMSDVTRQELLARQISPAFPALYLITLDTVTLFAFSAIALFIVLRQPDDWMVMLSSLTLVGTALIYTVPGSHPALPIWIPAGAIALAEIFQVAFVYLFPTGQFFPRWLGFLLVPMLLWRPAIWIITYLPDYLAAPHTAENYGALRQNTIDTGLMLLLFMIGIGTQVYRYRRVYNRTQQLQTKVVLTGILVAVIITGTYIIVVNALGMVVPGGANELLALLAGRTVRQIALFMVPLSLAFSVLRYRLWDIDILLGRTLVYGPLTAILAGLFAAMIPVVQHIAIALTGQQTFLATILATIVVVAAFDPLKHAISGFVQRRYQHGPDTKAELDNFGERVQKRLSAVDQTQILRRFTDEAVRAFQAEGGATFLAQGNELVPVYACGRDATYLIVEVSMHGKRIGQVALGERSDDRPYSRGDRALLEKTAAVVGNAIEQDTAAL